MKRCLLAVLAVFVAWSVLDFVIHGVLLSATYAATAQLWRPMAEMKVGLMRAVTLLSAVSFTGIYRWLVNPKSLAAGIKLGFFYGLATGIPMGFGTFSVMPIPVKLAAVWAIGSIVAATVAGLLVAAILKRDQS